MRKYECTICRKNLIHEDQSLCLECEALKIDWSTIGVDVYGCSIRPGPFHTNITKPNEHLVFLQMAHISSTRSPDSNTKHGCVLVKDKRVVSTGYNGFIMGSNDQIMPNNRQGGFKYGMILHSEINAIINAARNGVSIKDSVAYITGEPCTECAKCLIQVGCKTWYVGDIKHTRTPEDEILLKFLILHHQVKMIHLNLAEPSV